MPSDTAEETIQMSPVPDDGRTGFVDRLESTDGRIEMGIYPVIYGYRLRAGWNGDGVCQLDWCCGNNQALLYWLYYRLKEYIEAHPEEPFSELPSCSSIKPLYKDQEFLEAIGRVFNALPVTDNSPTPKEGKMSDGNETP